MGNVSTVPRNQMPATGVVDDEGGDNDMGSSPAAPAQGAAPGSGSGSPSPEAGAGAISEYHRASSSSNGRPSGSATSSLKRSADESAVDLTTSTGAAAVSVSPEEQYSAKRRKTASGGEAENNGTSGMSSTAVQTIPGSTNQAVAQQVQTWERPVFDGFWRLVGEFLATEDFVNLGHLGKFAREDVEPARQERLQKSLKTWTNLSAGADSRKEGFWETWHLCCFGGELYRVPLDRSISPELGFSACNDVRRVFLDVGLPFVQREPCLETRRCAANNIFGANSPVGGGQMLPYTVVTCAPSFEMARATWLKERDVEHLCSILADQREDPAVRAQAAYGLGGGRYYSAEYSGFKDQTPDQGRIVEEAHEKLMDRAVEGLMGVLERQPATTDADGAVANEEAPAEDDDVGAENGVVGGAADRVGPANGVADGGAPAAPRAGAVQQRHPAPLNILVAQAAISALGASIAKDVIRRQGGAPPSWIATILEKRSVLLGMPLQLLVKEATAISDPRSPHRPQTAACNRIQAAMESLTGLAIGTNDTRVFEMVTDVLVDRVCGRIRFSADGPLSFRSKTKWLQSLPKEWSEVILGIPELVERWPRVERGGNAFIDLMDYASCAINETNLRICAMGHIVAISSRKFLARTKPKENTRGADIVFAESGNCSGGPRQVASSSNDGEADIGEELRLHIVSRMETMLRKLFAAPPSLPSLTAAPGIAAAQIATPNTPNTPTAESPPELEQPAEPAPDHDEEEEENPFGLLLFSHEHLRERILAMFAAITRPEMIHQLQTIRAKVSKAQPAHLITAVKNFVENALVLFFTLEDLAPRKRKLALQSAAASPRSIDAVMEPGPGAEAGFGGAFRQGRGTGSVHLSLANSLSLRMLCFLLERTSVSPSPSVQPGKEAARSKMQQACRSAILGAWARYACHSGGVESPLFEAWEVSISLSSEDAARGNVHPQVPPVFLTLSVQDRAKLLYKVTSGLAPGSDWPPGAYQRVHELLSDHMLSGLKEERGWSHTLVHLGRAAVVGLKAAEARRRREARRQRGAWEESEDDFEVSDSNKASSDGEEEGEEGGVEGEGQ